MRSLFHRKVRLSGVRMVFQDKRMLGLVVNDHRLVKNVQMRMSLDK